MVPLRGRAILACCLAPLIASPLRAQIPTVDRHGDPLPPGAVARLGTVRLRAVADALAVAPQGKTLVTVARDRVLRRWDAGTGRLRSETYLPRPPLVLTRTGWLSPEGSTLAACEDGKLALWDTATGQRRRLLAVEPTRCAFAPDGKTLATAEHQKRPARIRLWDLATGEGRILAELPSYARDLVFAPDGKRLYVAVDGHRLSCWDTAAGRELWWNDHGAERLAVAPDGRTLASDTYLHRAVRLWDASTGRPLATLGEGPEWTGGLAFAPDGKSLAQGTTGEVLIWDVAGRKLRHRLDAPGPHVAFAPDGSLFTLGTLLLRWDVVRGKLLYSDTRAEGHIGAVTAVAFAPDGRSLASQGADSTVRLWRLADGTHRVLRRDAPSGRVREIAGRVRLTVGTAAPLAFTPDGRYLLTDVAATDLALTDVATGEEARRFRLDRPKNAWVVFSAARLTEDGRTLLAMARTYPVEVVLGSLKFLERRNEPVLAWDSAGRGVVARSEAPQAMPGEAEFSPDGRLLALPALGQLRAVRGGGVRGLEGAEAGGPIAFSPDGRLLAVTEPGRFRGPARAVRVQEVLTGRLLARVDAPLGSLVGVALSPDGRLLAVPGPDALHVWEALTGRRLLRLQAQGRVVGGAWSGFGECLAFAPDGGSLATGHADGTVLLWDMAPARKGLTVPGPADPEACWRDLAESDPVTAWAAIERLAATPVRAVPLLRERLHPVKVDPKWLAGRLEELDSRSFSVREAATRELGRVAEAVESELRRAMEQATAEARARLGGILAALESRRAAVPSGDVLRQLRALAVLERIGSEEARAVLRGLGEGASEARLTQEARASLERLTRQPGTAAQSR